MGEKARHILGLSGGKDSTALALFMRDKVPQMEYVFCDTGSELEETYSYLNQVEAYLGKPIIRLNPKENFEHWLKVFGGYLPAPNMRWCTKLLKLKPFEDYVGSGEVVSYVGIRADENRMGYVSTKPNIKPVFPFKEYGIDYSGVMRILTESGIGLPPYLKWGRSHSGCFFCFFQKQIEWVRLLETHPAQFDIAQSYEKMDLNDSSKSFTWNQGMSLSELRKKENVLAIKTRYEEMRKRRLNQKSDRRLVEVLGGLELEENDVGRCDICHL